MHLHNNISSTFHSYIPLAVSQARVRFGIPRNAVQRKKRKSSVRRVEKCQQINRLGSGANKNAFLCGSLRERDVTNRRMIVWQHFRVHEENNTKQTNRCAMSAQRSAKINRREKLERRRLHLLHPLRSHECHGKKTSTIWCRLCMHSRVQFCPLDNAMPQKCTETKWIECRANAKSKHNIARTTAWHYIKVVTSLFISRNYWLIATLQCVSVVNDVFDCTAGLNKIIHFVHEIGSVW